jgi:hypothetical protein
MTFRAFWYIDEILDCDSMTATSPYQVNETITTTASIEAKLLTETQEGAAAENTAA